MDSSAVVDVRNARSLDLATYGVLVVMGALGLSGLPGWAARATAIGLCIAFALNNAVGPRLARTPRQLTGFFALQTGLIVALLALRSSAFDSFTFLLFMLSVQVALVFPARRAAIWIGLFWLISSLIMIWNLGAAGIFGVLFNAAVYAVCGVFGTALRATALAKRENEVLLRELHTAQRQAQELAIAAERNRLARDLHDSIKQQVFAAIMQLGAARVLLQRDPQAARKHVVEAEQLAQQAGTELTLVIHELRPVALGDTGLAEALRAYVADWSRQSGIRAGLQVRGDGAVPVTTAYELLRIAQEALANVARHSRAAAVTLALHYDEGAVSLTIADDGQGFDQQAVAAGVGLASMRERIEALGGCLRVDSRPGAGTTINARWEATHA